MVAHPVFTNAFLDQLRLVGDPPLNELLIRMADDMGGIWRIRDLFHRVPDLPRLGSNALEDLHDHGLITQTLVDFFESDCRVPKADWIDPDLVAAGGRFYRDRGIAGFVVLAFASLPACYCWSTKAEVLG